MIQLWRLALPALAENTAIQLSATDHGNPRLAEQSQLSAQLALLILCINSLCAHDKRCRRADPLANTHHDAHITAWL